jgi:hypothetical protein
MTDFTFLDVAAENLRQKAEDEARARREEAVKNAPGWLEAAMEAYARQQAGIKPN